LDEIQLLTGATVILAVYGERSSL